MASRRAVLLTPSRSSHLTQLLSRQQSAPISPLAATVMYLSASIANKRLTRLLNPLDATLTRNRGVGVLWLTCPRLATVHFPRASRCSFLSQSRPPFFSSLPTVRYPLPTFLFV